MLNMASHAPSTTGTPVGNAAPSANPSSSAQLAVGQLPSLQQLPQIRDPEWLKLEVCREFQRGACKRIAEECKYAHPPKNVQIMPDGKVIACFDALKRRCSRETCKYLHPPDHLKQQLEINGRNNLIQQRAMLQMLPLQQTIYQTQPVQHGSMQVGANNHQIMNSLPATQLYSPSAVANSAAASHAAAYPVYQPELALNHQLLYYPTTLGATGHAMNLASVAPTLATQHIAGRADRLEVCRDFQRNNCNRGEHECRYAHPEDRSMIDQTDNTVTVCMDCIKGRCTRDKCKYFHPPPHLQAKIKASQQQPFGTALPSPQQTVMISNNGQPLGQPPMKRHAMDTTKVGTPTSPTLSAHLPATNGVHNLGYNTYFMQHPTPQYYPIQMVQMYNGGLPNAVTPIPSPGLPSVTVANDNVSVNPSSSTFAILNGAQGQNQIMLK